MQWRLALQGVFNYFAHTSFVPIMFHFHGPEIAGKMGMTIQIITTIMMLSQIWIQTKIPKMGILVSQENFVALNNIWKRFSIISFLMATSMAFCFIFAIIIMDYLSVTLSNRILDLNLVIIFLLSYLIVQIPNYQSIYLRAFAKEAFLPVGIIAGISIGSGLLIFGGIYGAVGAAYSHFAVTTFITTPLAYWIWAKKKSEWCKKKN